MAIVDIVEAAPVGFVQAWQEIDPSARGGDRGPTSYYIGGASPAVMFQRSKKIDDPACHK